MLRVPNVLIVDDDDALRETLVDQLAVDGEFTAIEAATIEDGLRVACDERYRLDLIILDVGLPDGDGRDLCAVLRRRGVRIPIIFLTGFDSEQDVIKGFECGGNDYIAKPFKLSILLARVRVQVRAFEDSIHAILHLGPYRFHIAHRMLLDAVRDRRIRLTEKETAILRLLALSSHGLSKHILVKEIWGGNSVTVTKTLDNHIYRLRQKLAPDPTNALLLVAEDGRYRLDVKPNSRDRA